MGEPDNAIMDAGDEINRVRLSRKVGTVWCFHNVLMVLKMKIFIRVFIYEIVDGSTLMSHNLHTVITN